MDIQKLIAKIRNLHVNIENQSKISQLDIDLQLSYLRELYDAYLEMKYNPAEVQPCVAEKTQEELPLSALSECGALSLFGDCEETGKTDKIGEMDKMDKVVEPEEKIVEEPEKEAEETEEEPEEEPEEIEEEEEEFEEEAEEEDFEEEEEEESEKEDFEEEEVEEEVESTKIEEPESEEDDLPIIEMEAKMDYSTPDISIVPEAVTEKTVADINLDNIEFDEDSEDEEEETETETETVKHRETPFHPSMPHSRYYGDEIEVENPIPVKTSIGDSFKGERPSLNDIVSGYRPDESIAAKLQQGNISNLMTSIDMNNKFLFVKVLFNNNGSLFTEEINKLNSFNKLNEAIPYLETIKEKYNWETQSEAYSELYRLVLRKFAK